MALGWGYRDMSRDVDTNWDVRDAQSIIELQEAATLDRTPWKPPSSQIGVEGTRQGCPNLLDLLLTAHLTSNIFCGWPVFVSLPSSPLQWTFFILGQDWLLAPFLWVTLHALGSIQAWMYGHQDMARYFLFSVLFIHFFAKEMIRYFNKNKIWVALASLRI